MQNAKPRYIIISCVRSLPEDVGDIQSAPTVTQASLGQNKALREISSYQVGILRNPRLLNVFLTRARYGLVCIGNRPESQGNQSLHSLLLQVSLAKGLRRSILANGSQDLFDLTESLEKRGCIISSHDFQHSRLTRRRVSAQHSVRPEDSISNGGLAGDRDSVVSTSLSIISAGGPKCFLTGWALLAASRVSEAPSSRPGRRPWWQWSTCNVASGFALRKTGRCRWEAVQLAL